MLKSLLLMLLAFTSVGVCAMSLTDIGKVCLFSEMSGVLTVNGLPAANVRLVRTAKWQSEHQDETTTDADGHFHFPEMTERTVAKFLPMEFVASQSLTAFYDGTKIQVWRGIKRTSQRNAESRGTPLNVTCELFDEEKSITVNGGPIFSRCNWDVKPDPSEDWIWENGVGSEKD